MASYRALHTVSQKNSLRQNSHLYPAFYAFKNCHFCTILLIIGFSWKQNALSIANAADGGVSAYSRSLARCCSNASGWDSALWHANTGRKWL